MSNLRLRETFNGLLSNWFFSSLKKGAAAFTIVLALSGSVVADAEEENMPQNAGTEHSQHLQSIQEEFNQAVQDRRMILVDRDWLQINTALENPTNEQDIRNKMLQNYILDRGNINIDETFFEQMTDRDLLMPHTQIITLTNGQGDQMRGCMVYGGRGELDGEEAVRDFVDLSTAMHGQTLDNADVLNAPNAEAFKEFITYHEIGHCMDDFFISEMNNAQSLQEYLAYYHRAESFSDVYGALMMARNEGVTDIADKVARLRLANMALTGPIQVEYASANSPGHYMSYIYATHRPVSAAQDYLDQNGTAGLENMSVQEVAELARDIVNQHALTQKEADALMYLFAMDHDMSVWEGLKDQVSYINERYDDAVTLRQEMDQALREQFDLGQIPAGSSALDLISFDGTIVDLIIERNQELDLVELETRARVLADELLQLAGTGADENRLVEVFIQEKDQWRRDLDDQDSAIRESARENLEVATKALRRAVMIVRGQDPDVSAVQEPTETVSPAEIGPHMH